MPEAQLPAWALGLIALLATPTIAAIVRAVYGWMRHRARHGETIEDRYVGTSKDLHAARMELVQTAAKLAEYEDRISELERQSVEDRRMWQRREDRYLRRLEVVEEAEREKERQIASLREAERAHIELIARLTAKVKWCEAQHKGEGGERPTDVVALVFLAILVSGLLTTLMAWAIPW